MVIWSWRWISSPRFPAGNEAKPVEAAKKKRASFKCGKIPTSLFKFPNYFLGSGQCWFSLACMCPTNTTQPASGGRASSSVRRWSPPFPPGSREQSRRRWGLFLGDPPSYPGDRAASIPAVTTIFAGTGSEILLQLLWRRVSLQAACQVTRSQRKHHFRKRNRNNYSFFIIIINVN